MSEYVVEVEYDTLNGTFSQKRGEEIVRCGDCRWRKGVVCGYFDKITWVMDFCSHGTRRTE